MRHSRFAIHKHELNQLRNNDVVRLTGLTVSGQSMVIEEESSTEKIWQSAL